MTLRERLVQAVIRAWGFCVAPERPKPAVRIRMRDRMSWRLRRLQRQAVRWKARA